MTAAGQDRAGVHAPVGADAWVTPDAVELDLATATVGSRGIAYLIDLALLFVGYVLIGLAQTLLGVSGFVSGWAGIAVLLVLAFAWQFGYPIGFEVLWRGRTPGKAAMGLRAVTVEGLPVGVRHATIRAIIGLLELLGTMGLLAVVSSLVSSRGQRLGDLAAGTVVLRERRAGSRPTAMVYPTPVGWESYVARLDIAALGDRDRAAIRDTLRRLDELPRAARDQVVGQLAGALAPRVAPPPPAGMTAETWIRCVGAALQRGRQLPRATAAAGFVPPPPPSPPAPAPPAGAAAGTPDRAAAVADGEVSGPGGGGGARQDTEGEEERPGSTGGFVPPT